MDSRNSRNYDDPRRGGRPREQESSSRMDRDRRDRDRDHQMRREIEPRRSYRDEACQQEYGNYIIYVH